MSKRYQATHWTHVRVVDHMASLFEQECHTLVRYQDYVQRWVFVQDVVVRELVVDPSSKGSEHNP